MKLCVNLSQSSAQGPLTTLVGAASGLSASPTSTLSVLDNIVPHSSITQAKNRSLSTGLPGAILQPSASSSRQCDCQCLCPISSFPILRVVTASPVSPISTFQTLLSFVTPGQSISRLAPSQPLSAILAQTASKSITLSLCSELPPLSLVSHSNLISPGSIPFDIKTFSLLDEVTVPISI